MCSVRCRPIKVDLHKVFISQWQDEVPKIGVEETIIKTLENWCDKKGPITLFPLTHVLYDIELKSTTDAIKMHFNASIFNKSPEIPKAVTISKGNIYNRMQKTVFKPKQAKSIKITRHLLAPLIDVSKARDSIECEKFVESDISLEKEHKKRFATDWLKKLHFIVDGGCVINSYIITFVTVQFSISWYTRKEF